MQPTLATLIGIFKASNTSAVCKKMEILMNQVVKSSKVKKTVVNLL